MQKQRLAWAISGSGHYLREALDLLATLPDVDVFLSKAAAEIIQQYGFQAKLEGSQHRVYYDKTASSVPVGLLYSGHYHTLVIAPATSNTIAKMAYGFSDSLVTNLYAQAGKTRVPSLVFACDTVPEQSAGAIESEAPRQKTVQVYPRKIDLANVARLAEFEATSVFSDIPALATAINQRLHALGA